MASATRIGEEQWHMPTWFVGRATLQHGFIGLFVLALVPRLVLLVAAAGRLQFWEYETLAENIAGGSGYVITRFGHVAFAFGDGNLYSFLAASVYMIWGHQPGILAIVQAVLASMAAPVIFALGMRAFGDARVAGLGAAMAALHPGLLAYTTKLHPLGLDVLLMALMVLWITCVADGPRHALGAGFAMGLTLMSRPTFLLAGLVSLVVRARGAREFVVPTVTALCVVAVLAAPWVTRNWLILGRPVFVSTSLEDVWKGNNPIASGSSYLSDGKDVFSASPPEVQARFHQPNELALNEVFGEEVLGFIRDRPADFVGLLGRKFLYFWWLPPTAGLLYPPGWVAPYELYATVVYAFALVGAVAILRGGSVEERRLLGTLAAIGLTLAVIHALAYVEGRHRWGIEPLLLLLTARGLFVSAAALRGLVPIQPGLFRRQSTR